MQKQRNEVVCGDKKLISFCSNDYLGLSQHPDITKAFKKGIDQFGVGGISSQFICGYTKYHHELEEKLAAFFETERAIVFSTGYMANLGILNTLIEKDDFIFADKLCHASIIDGIQNSGVGFKRYLHNNDSHLEKLINQISAKQKWIITEGIFSMDGDIAPLPKIIDLKKKHQAKILVDDACGIGVMGNNGRGTLEYLNIRSKDVDVLAGTFGKAFGGFGAFVVGDQDIIDYLIQYCRPLMYTTAIPPAMACAMAASINIIEKENHRRSKLHHLIHYFRKSADNMNVNLMDSLSPIQPIIIGDNKKVMDISRVLQKKGFWVGAIRPPTVPNNTARLKINLNTDHTEKQIKRLLEAIADAAK